MSEIKYELQIIDSLYKQNNKLVIFDIGGHDFQDSITFKKSFPDASVYSFEPNITNINKYKHDAEINSVKVLELAISDTNEDVIFYPSLIHTASGSILKPLVVDGTRHLREHPHFEFDIDGYLVKSVRLDTFCKSNSIEHIDYIHVDAQGAEYKIMMSIGDFRPSYIFAETCAFDSYDTGVDVKKFNNLMYDLGYEIHTTLPYDTLYIYKSE